jgi:uncharacterized protein (DUF58 family)
MNTTELLKKVRRIEIKTKGLSKHLFSGDYHSAFKGRGMSFSDVRAYQYGDDVRNIDWNVTARTNEPFVKQFEEERELTVMLLADVSASVYFGTGEASKSAWITELCAVLAFSAISNQDKVGLILFTDQIEMYIPPKKGRKHILRIIRELINFEAGNNQTDIGLALKYLNNVIKKRSICFLLSDYISKPYGVPLKVSAKRHDLISILIYDHFEKEMNRKGLMRVFDPELNRNILLDTGDKRLVQQWNSHFENHIKSTKELMARSGADMMILETNHPYESELHRFFKQRASRH